MASAVPIKANHKCRLQPLMRNSRTRKTQKMQALLFPKSNPSSPHRRKRFLRCRDRLLYILLTVRRSHKRSLKL